MRPSILKPFKLFVLVDEKNRDLADGHMIMWRIFNNTDAQRDLYREGDRALFDATYKLPEEGYKREWPPDMFMDDNVIKKSTIILVHPNWVFEFSYAA